MNRLFKFSWSTSKSQKVNSLTAIVNLPSNLLHLLEYYETGSNSFNRQYLKKEDDQIILTCFKFKNGNYENFISGLLDLDEIETEVKDYRQAVDKYHHQGFIKIGYFDIRDLLLISLKRESYGLVSILEINPIDSNDGDRIKDLGINIMVFLNELTEELIVDNINTHGITVNDLYHKWNDNAWNV